MRKVELLAPAGSMSALKAAISNGADAVYLGGQMFGARAYAQNFDTDEMKEAIRLAHSYDVSVYVTMNTLIHEDEIEKCMEYVDFLYHADVDALIIQDSGLMELIRKTYPDLELHCSTQMHIHNKNGIMKMKELGAQRVVLARETCIEDVKKYSELGIDLEVFVYGAICVGYSGQCLMSAVLKNRSGNRGECAQTCRLPYDLIQIENGKKEKIETDGKYLLSPKDLNTLELVPQLIESGIHSFKIEGRMKRSEYVALITSLYRKAIDAYYDRKPFSVSEEMMKEMKKIFHRGFTYGHLFHQKGTDLMNAYRPNHIGIELGKITTVTKDKIRIKLYEDIKQGDGIRILGSKEDDGFMVNRLYKNNLLVNEAYAGDIIELDHKNFVEKGSLIVKTSDVKQLKALSETYDKILKRIPVKASIYGEIGKPLNCKVYDGIGNSVTVTSDICVEQALKTPLSEERIREQFSKTKDTPFEITEMYIRFDEMGILPIKELNRIRREALVLLDEKRQIRHVRNGKQNYVKDVCVSKTSMCLKASVRTLEQFDVCRKENISEIYVTTPSLYEKVKNEKGVYKAYSKVEKKDCLEPGSLIKELGGIGTGMIADASLNVMNHYSAAYLFGLGCKCVTLSTEISLENTKELVDNFIKAYGNEPNLELIAYEHQELMISEYCVINRCLKDNGKKKCALCKGKVKYALKDYTQRSYPVYGDEDCRMHILNDEVKDLSDEILDYIRCGVKNIRLNFTIENQSETTAIVRKYKKLLEKEVYGE